MKQAELNPRQDLDAPPGDEEMEEIVGQEEKVLARVHRTAAASRPTPGVGSSTTTPSSSRSATRFARRDSKTFLRWSRKWNGFSRWRSAGRR